MNTAKKNLPVKKPFSYKERHAVIIEVETEKQQKKLFTQLKNQGHKKLKIVSV